MYNIMPQLHTHTHKLLFQMVFEIKGQHGIFCGRLNGTRATAKAHLLLLNACAAQKPLADIF